MNSVGPIAMGLVTGGTVYLAAREILGGALTLGDLVSFMAFFWFMIAPMTQLMPISTSLAEGVASLNRAQELLHHQPEDENPRRTQVMGPIRGSVAFEDVSFGHGGANEVLHTISFQATPGTSTALIGASGAGKTTVIALLAAFYEPSAGVVRVDGIDLSTVRLDSYRSQLGVVLQDILLLDGTIRDNVAFARPDADEAAIREACRIAHVHEFAERSPDGYNTIVGERGIKLSAGQRQRIAIARAILADPRILILDEATSSLDSESEAAIKEALAYIMKGRTTVLITHRLTMARHADQILVLESGRIVERGTPDGLYAKRGRYYQLTTRQLESGGGLVARVGVTTSSSP
jgi:subfamily B ATP-binding cassette protein MsbA